MAATATAAKPLKLDIFDCSRNERNTQRIHPSGNRTRSATVRVFVCDSFGRIYSDGSACVFIFTLPNNPRKKFEQEPVLTFTIIIIVIVIFDVIFGFSKSTIVVVS